MRFTITYDGALPSRGTVAEKEQIREHLHPQLRELWTHEPLSGHSKFLEPPASANEISVLVHQGTHVFAPLVCDRLHLIAELDILLLRPELPGRIVTSGGDIDNRLKTLFDALRAPSNAQELAPTARQSSVTDPTFTLLEDDALISRVNVDTDRLLGASTPDDVRLIIRVAVRASRWIYGNQDLVF